MIEYLKICQHPSGGFSGGPYQEPHIAATYAAVCCIIILNEEDAYQIVNREKLYQFLIKMKQEEGFFTLHEGGEFDLRGVYCALLTSWILNILDEKLAKNVINYIQKCQTYEGGLGGEPYSEAHGGYTFCGLASISVLKKAQMLPENSLDFNAVLRWATYKQMEVEGGFQGRTNKLVDSCYSF